MILRTIFYALIFFGVYWLIRRVMTAVFGMGGKATAGRKSRRKGNRSHAVDAEFEIIDEKRKNAQSQDDSAREA
jgi:hypothetical protein